jgi:uncharacterized protein YrrD
MDIPMQAQVRCTDDICGTSYCVILNPIDDQITHIVVQANTFPHIKRLVPVERIKETSSNMIQLDCDLYEFVNLPEFIQSDFIIPSPYGGKEEIPTKMLLPYALIMGTVTEEHESIPQHELAIHRGTHVVARDGRVGQVDEFIIEPKTGCITYIVLSEGHLWGRKEISIPISEIDHIEKDTVYLKLNKREIATLPPIPIDRPGRK